MKILFRGFNYSQDGPGNRLVYHLQGCNLHCPWCSNPESMPMEGAFMKRREVIYSDYKLSCQTMTIEQVVEEAVRSRPMYFSGGGVTFTGGEPTLQFTELKAVLKELHGQSIDTAIETNATHPQLCELVPLLDHIIIDFKHFDDQKLLRTIGTDTVTIRKNIASILASGRRIHLRTPLIHGFNDSDEEQQGLLNYYRGINASNLTVELLSYHEFGKEKWEQCGKEYTIKDGFVDVSVVKDLQRALVSAGIQYQKT